MSEGFIFYECTKTCETRGFHCGGDDDIILLDFDAAYNHRKKPTFRRNMLLADCMQKVCLSETLVFTQRKNPGEQHNETYFTNLS
jgi:hypothetical protein